jgi:hypothetical protein
MRHRRAVTLALLIVLVLNLTVVGGMAPVDGSDLSGGMPVAARCQGGGPGCAEQPLIPPPAGGLPRFDGPATPVFGAMLLVEPRAPFSLRLALLDPVERPPVLRAV